MTHDLLFHPFDTQEIQGMTLPEQFTFPFFYQPHPLAKLAAEKLQAYLTNQTDFVHAFGTDPSDDSPAIGKMFGVLVVRNQAGELGYLCAFSGKVGGSNAHVHFVPPVFDMLTEEGFFVTKLKYLTAINTEVDAIEADAHYQHLSQQFEKAKQDAEEAVAAYKEIVRRQKAERKIVRQLKKAQLSPEAYAEVEADLIKQSLRDKHELNVLMQHWAQKLEDLKSELAPQQDRLEFLKEERKTKSAALQEELFKAYSFLNGAKQEKSLHAIFSETVFGKPPAAAGECATPKTLQYAFLHDYEPLAMAEFWWGSSPKSEIRQHGQYYPACTGKCEPILKHMLQGMDVEPNPFLVNWGADKSFSVVFEDEEIIVVNKPHDLLSVPGIHVQDSVYTRLKARLAPVEPLVIHRLDMPTSGLLVFAKTKSAHHFIQRQFLTKRVKKRYTALLERPIETDKGEINLPLALDVLNRPMQKVCFEEGKPSVTQFEVVERTATTTRIHFWPLTGRTHQLRMHAAHQLGLHAPIVGDELYGTPNDRLYLQAAYLSFQHPTTLQQLEFEVPADF